MKRLNILLMACLMSVMASAQQPDLVIPKLPDGLEINVNGEDDEVFWDAINPNVIEKEDTYDYGDANFNEAYFKMAYNDTALFLIIVRDEDEFCTPYCTGLSNWQSDCEEIFFDVRVDSLNDGLGASLSQEYNGEQIDGTDAGHYQFTSQWVLGENSTGDDILDTYADTIPNTNQWYHNTPHRFSYTIDNNKYITEYVIPFSSLTVDTGIFPDSEPQMPNEAGTVFGMEIRMIDVDKSDDPTDESFRKIVCWHDITSFGWTNMDKKARVQLGEEDFFVMSQTDLSALLAIDSICDTDDNLNWDTEPDPENWDSVTWNYEVVRRVTELNIGDKNLSGHLDVSELSALNELDCSQNQLVDITVTNLSGLTYLDCSDNKLTFLTLPLINIDDYIYSPQDSVFTPKVFDVDVSLNYSAHALVGETATYFSFHKDHVPVELNNSGKFTTTGPGVYHCEMIHDRFPELTLTTATTTILDVTTNIGEIQERQFTVYPNPTRGQVNIRAMAQVKDGEIVVYAMDGKQLYQEKWNGTTTMIDLSGLEEGVYLLQIRYGDSLETKRIKINK